MAFTLMHAHAMFMILSWMTFGSTGILFARYGRSLRLGARRQLLGKAVWFQIHRFLLSWTPLLTLLGFFFILVYAKGQWVNPQIVSIRLFIHSVLGGTIVCCTILQVWLALYRCHPRSRFRYIFDWSHRIIGSLAFCLSIPTMFLVIVGLQKYRTNLIIIISLWAGWIFIIIFIFEIIECQQRAAVLPIRVNAREGDINQETNNANALPDIEAGTNTNVGSQRHNKMKLLLLFLHIIVSNTLSISLIVFICS